MNNIYALKYLFLFVIFILINDSFKLYFQDENDINIAYKTSNISIIIETDDFDYYSFHETWGKVLTKIPFQVKSVYFYVHKQYKKSSNRKKTPKYKFMLEKLSNISFPRIIISDFPDNGYLPLMISSYTDDMYPLQVVCYIDARKISRQKHIYDFIHPKSSISLNFKSSTFAKWIKDSYKMHIDDPSLATVFGFHTKTKIKDPNTNQYTTKVVGCNMLMTKESIIRELLYYTKVKMDSPSPFLTLSLINDQKAHNSFNLITSSYIKNVDFFPFSKPKKNVHQSTEPFKCPETIVNKSDTPTFSVFIPCFKRNYFNLTFSQLSQQTVQPEYYVLVQNRFYVYLDVPGELQRYLGEKQRPIYKIWMLNYNPFFILPNLVTSLFNTDFVIRLDDDHIPRGENFLSLAVKHELQENMQDDVIVGERLSVLNILVGNFINSKQIRIDCRGYQADYVASPYIYRPIQMKISGRLKPLFLGGGEDAHFGLSAAIECNSKSKLHHFEIQDFSGDMFRHGLDHEIKDYIGRTVKLPGELIHNVYAYYVKIGLKPRCWQNFVLEPSEMINGSVYTHTSFL